MDRRSLFKSLGAGMLAGAMPSVAAATIPEEYEIDFDLVTPWGNLYFDEEKTGNGFDLRISVDNGDVDGDGFCESHAYEGEIRWWILPSIGAPRSVAYRSGVATAFRETDDPHDYGIIRVTF